MTDKTWKKAERRVAGLFGARRTPLSGGNSAHTRSDSLHERLFIETRYRARFAVVNWFIDTAAKAGAERKLPVLVLVEKHRKLVFALVPLKRRYLWSLLQELVEGEPTQATDDGFRR